MGQAEGMNIHRCPSCQCEPKPKKHCCDCGVDIGNRSTRCGACNGLRITKQTSSYQLVADLIGSGLTMEEIGKRVGVSRQRVHQIIRYKGSLPHVNKTIASPMTPMKPIRVCRVCGTRIPLPRRAFCSEGCKRQDNSARCLQWQRDNKEHMDAYRREYVANNSERVARHQKTYTLRHPEKRRVASKAYYERNRKRIQAYERIRYQRRKANQATPS